MPKRGCLSRRKTRENWKDSSRLKIPVFSTVAAQRGRGLTEGEAYRPYRLQYNHYYHTLFSSHLVEGRKSLAARPGRFANRDRAGRVSCRLADRQKKFRIGQQSEASASGYRIRKCGANPALTLRAAVCRDIRFFRDFRTFPKKKEKPCFLKKKQQKNRYQAFRIIS